MRFQSAVVATVWRIALLWFRLEAKGQALECDLLQWIEAHIRWIEVWYCKYSLKTLRLSIG